MLWELDSIRLHFWETVKRLISLIKKVMQHLGATANWNNVGQVYPRSLDFEVVSLLVRLSSAPSSFAKTLRIMAGHELLGEGFAKGQTGSSAMPHKMNSRSCERINGFQAILNGYLTMMSNLSWRSMERGGCILFRSKKSRITRFFFCDRWSS